MYDVILKYASYIFLLVGFSLVIIPAALAYHNGIKQTKEVFLINNFVPNIIGLFFIAFGYWGSMQNVTSETFWYVMIVVTATGGIFLSLVSAYMSTVLLRWRSD